MTLLSEKRVFEIQEKVLMPEFITDPFTHNILSQGTPLSLFSFFPENQTGIILESHMMQGIQPEEIFDTIFPHEKKQVIEVNRKIKNQRKIDTTRGDVTVEISSGTVIRTLSGDIIDTALIDITSLDSAKKFKAKSKYEKKMKNRGSIRK